MLPPKWMCSFPPKKIQKIAIIHSLSILLPLLSTGLAPCWARSWGLPECRWPSQITAAGSPIAQLSHTTGKGRRMASRSHGRTRVHLEVGFSENPILTPALQLCAHTGPQWVSSMELGGPMSLLEPDPGTPWAGPFISSVHPPWLKALIWSPRKWEHSRNASCGHERQGWSRLSLSLSFSSLLFFYQVSSASWFFSCLAKSHILEKKTQ